MSAVKLPVPPGLDEFSENEEVIRANAPDWLLLARPERIVQLREYMSRSQLFKDDVSVWLRELKPVRAFCEPLLAQRLQERFGAGLDLHKDMLVVADRWPEFPSPLGAPVVFPMTFTQHGLLDAALQNFAADEQFPPQTYLRFSGSARPEFTPQAFIDQVRELDLGGRYQQHLCRVLHLPLEAGQEVDADGARIEFAMQQQAKADMLVDATIALMKKELDESAHTQLCRLIESNVSVAADGARIQANELQMLGVTLSRVRLFTLHTGPSDGDRGLLVHIPNDPLSRFRFYPSLEDFRAELCERLWQPSYEAFFSRLVEQRDLPAFLAALRRSLSRETLSAKALLNRQADLKLRLLPSNDELFSLLHRQQLQRLQDDARAVAVPTEDVDQDARNARYQARLGLGMTLLNLASFANPWLGLLMMGVAVGEMLAEVYEGYQDWQRGDHDQAITHMMAVAEDLATMIALGATLQVGGKLVKGLFRQESAFFDELVPVRSDDGRYRLWQPSLEPYAHDEPLLARQDPDTQGFYPEVSDDGHRYLDIAGRPYRAYRDEAADAWRLRHRSRPSAYEPLLEHNGAGAWRLAHEWPPGWEDPAYLLRRLGPEAAWLDDVDIERILSIHRLDAPLLHRLHMNRAQIPATVLDSIRRFRLDRELGWLADAADAPPARRLLDLKLQILPDLPGWPRGRTILLLDAADKPLYEYGVDLTSQPRPLKVAARDLEASGLQALIDVLDPAHRQALLGEPVEPGEELPGLERALQQHVLTHRHALFERVYRLRWLLADGLPESVRQRFPELPSAVLREVAEQSSVSVKDRLLVDSRLPLQLVEDLTDAAREVRVDRALEGGFLQSTVNPDTARLQLPVLEKMLGWPLDLRIELRQDAASGPLLAELGNVGLPRRRIFVRTEEGYQAFDASGSALGQRATGNDALSAALLGSLSVSERMAMGMRLEEEAQLHKLLLSTAMTRPRQELEATLGLAARKAEHEPAPWRRMDRSGCSRTRRGGIETTRRGLRRVTRLYPDLCEAEVRAFMLQLGDDSALVRNRIRSLELELELLRSLLNSWYGRSFEQRGQSIWLGGMQEGRMQASQILERCWRRQTPRTYDDSGAAIGYGLSLEGLRVVSLPDLPESIGFEHVTELSLKSMDLNMIPAGFLRLFPKLRKLDMANNRLRSLPAAIADMGELRELHLQDNRIMLDRDAAIQLSNLQQLEVLNLNGNSDVGRLDVVRMPHLRRLFLRGTGIDHLPEGLLTRTSLSAADLRGNLIQQLPAELYDAPSPITRRIILRHNPLGPANQSPLAAYRLRTGITFGIPESELALDEYSSRLRWLADVEGERRAQLQSLWQGLWHEPGSQELFDLLGRLGGSADYLKTRSDLTRRVWEVLEAAGEDGGLRRELFDLAANPLTCVDSAAQSFSHLEVRVLLAKARALAIEGDEPVQLLKLARGLFRLEQIDAIARSHVRALAENPEVPSSSAVDEIEVNLAYRIGLARLMHVPGQPREMLFRSIAHVTEEQIQAAHARILQAEQTPSLTTFIAGRDFWIDYLKKKYPRDFSRFNQPFHDQEEQLLRESPTMHSERYFRHLEALMDSHRAEEQMFLTSLTRQEMYEHPAPAPGS
ncbi:NEL-type E3 ubiquitin ligase domain-containing protein [Pseudomonas sp. COR18]|uniref:NEL-type E3 ubiquitin ligase domain-containing protein n=1 Tax=Pseudomonas sp. COR18 TaxID=3399680 RepID=UPI003B0070A8